VQSKIEKNMKSFWIRLKYCKIWTDMSVKDFVIVLRYFNSPMESSWLGRENKVILFI